MSDGSIIDGPLNEYGLWNKALINFNVSIGNDIIQLGNWKIGLYDSNNLLI